MGENSVAIGAYSGYTDQKSNSIAIGAYSGYQDKRPYTISIGVESGKQTQRIGSISIGSFAGQTNQSNYAISLGYEAGQTTQGSYAIAIGTQAGQIGQPANSIILNASGSALNGSAAGLFVDPIRSVSNANVLTYDTATKEITYVAKSFVIHHPTNIRKYLVHGCLEGPESGVYYRGTATIPIGTTSVSVQLPDYVPYLATDFTVHITPTYNGSLRTLNASQVREGTFTVYGAPGPFSWIVHGSRGTIDVEPDKTSVHVHGEGPYKWI
jgi:hypothetical protein